MNQRVRVQPNRIAEADGQLRREGHAVLSRAVLADQLSGWRPIRGPEFDGRSVVGEAEQLSGEYLVCQ